MWLWEGDPDEEIEVFKKITSPWEEEAGIKFSKNGIVEYIERTIKYESKQSEDAKTARLWEQKLNHKNILMYYLKNGGTKLSKD